MVSAPKFLATAILAGSILVNGFFDAVTSRRVDLLERQNAELREALKGDFLDVPVEPIIQDIKEVVAPHYPRHDVWIDGHITYAEPYGKLEFTLIAKPKVAGNAGP